MSTYDDYPRDLIGYGRNPPHPRWPGRARVALQFVLNYEEGGENSVLHGDAASETFLSEIIGAAAFPMRHMSMEAWSRCTSTARAPACGGCCACSRSASCR
jgi:allantoinase